jgi:hypothetical protein
MKIKRVGFQRKMKCPFMHVGYYSNYSRATNKCKSYLDAGG